jgi:DNA-binding response OmpR family regulator
MNPHCPTCGQTVALDDDRLLIDTGTGIVQRGSRRVRLCTGHSMTLLTALYAAYPGSMAYERILDRIWGHDTDGGPLTARNVLHVLMARMRPSLRQIGVGIGTDRASGLRLTIDPNWRSSSAENEKGRLGCRPSASSCVSLVSAVPASIR